MSRPPFDEAAWRAETIARREKTREWLRSSPMSYFAAVARVDFGAATSLVVGSGEGADVRLDDPSRAPELLKISLIGDDFEIDAIAPGASFQVAGAVQTQARVRPSPIKVGRFTLRLSHQGFPSVIVFDPAAIHPDHQPEPRWFPIAPEARVLARLEEAENQVETVIQSTRGTPRKALRLGVLTFELKGQPLRLEANRFLEPGVDENAVSVFFRDATSGRETYPVGRYVDPKPAGDGTWVLDFNAAYNPACAWSPHYNCPIPPRANTLRVAVEAGELTPPEH